MSVRCINSSEIHHLTFVNNLHSLSQSVCRTAQRDFGEIVGRSTEQQKKHGSCIWITI